MFYPAFPSVFWYRSDDWSLTTSVIHFVALFAAHKFSFVTDHPTNLTDSAFPALPTGSYSFDKHTDVLKKNIRNTIESVRIRTVGYWC